MQKQFDYGKKREQQTQGIRAAILKAAATRLHEGGPDNMSVRAIAADVGASTKVIYGNFGSKAGLIEALYNDGFEQLRRALTDAVERHSDEIEKLFALSAAWLEFADQNRRLYELMYGPQVRDLLPGESDREGITPLYDTMVELVEQVLMVTEGTDNDPRTYVRCLWVVLHGSASLEITTWMTKEEASSRTNRLVSDLFGIGPGSQKRTGQTGS